MDYVGGKKNTGTVCSSVGQGSVLITRRLRVQFQLLAEWSNHCWAPEHGPSVQLLPELCPSLLPDPHLYVTVGQKHLFDKQT